MKLTRLNRQLCLTKCYAKLVLPLISHLSDTELRECLINATTISANKVIEKFELMNQHYTYDTSSKCTCGIPICHVYFIRKINQSNVVLPIGCICIKKFDKFYQEFEHYDRVYWNPDKYCKHCGQPGLKGWRRGKVHKKCYRMYMLDKSVHSHVKTS